MITALIALVGPLLMPVVGGLVSGVGINLVGLLTSGGGKVAVKVVPLAVRLAYRILDDDGDDAKEEAKQLLGAADPRTVEKVRQDLRSNKPAAL